MKEYHMSDQVTNLIEAYDAYKKNVVQYPTLAQLFEKNFDDMMKIYKSTHSVHVVYDVIKTQAPHLFRAPLSTKETAAFLKKYDKILEKSENTAEKTEITEKTELETENKTDENSIKTKTTNKACLNEYYIEKIADKRIVFKLGSFPRFTQLWREALEKRNIDIKQIRTDKSSFGLSTNTTETQKNTNIELINELKEDKQKTTQATGDAKKGSFQPQ